MNQSTSTINERDNWVITLVGSGEVEHALGPAIDIVKEQGLELDYFKSLTAARDGRITAGPSSYACAEIHAYGRLQWDEARWRSEYRRMADRFATDTNPVDIIVQRKADFLRPKRLFCFDMDSTLIQGEVIDELAKMAGVADRVVAITASAMRGEIEFQESFRRRLDLLAGLPESRVRELIDRIPLMQGAERLFLTLHAIGARTAILSGGFTFFGAHLRDRLGVHHVHANHLQVEAGLVTGQVHGRIVDGARKAELLQEIAAAENIPLAEVVAVGDGANDLPMLALAGMGVALHAKPLVRATATHAMTHSGLDALLFALGIPDADWAS